METPNFLGLEPALSHPEKAKIAVFPCPYERTTSYMKGTARGPGAMLEASHQVEFFDSELGLEPCKVGIWTSELLSFDDIPESEALQKTEDAIFKAVQAGKFPVTFGGEHTITIAPVKALKRKYPSFSVLHFDAHSDMRDAYEGNKFSHASIMRRVHEVVEASYSIGIRAQCVEERKYLEANANRFGVLYDHELSRDGFDVDKALKYLPTEHVYLTIDLDYFSPSEMPSVGTPVPGGGFWHPTLRFLREVFRKRTIIGADIVELKPNPNELSSDFFAAQLAYKIMAYRFERELR